MKKLLIPVACFLLMISTATAQERKSKERKQNLKHQKHEIKKELNLSDDQKNKMKSINEKYHDQTKALKSNDDISRGDFKKQMRELQEKRKVEMQAILTAEQQNKMKEMKQNKEKEMKEKSAERFEKMSDKLQLNENQKATLLEQQRKNQEQIKLIRENKSLSEDKKREQIKLIREKQKVDAKSILTEEQKKKLEHRKKDGKA